MIRLRLDEIRANPWNSNFLSSQEKAGLKRRMEEDGPEQTPEVVVRKTGDTYELVDGEQRWRIASELGWGLIRAIDRDADDLQAKALCVGYNRWRGRLNWFKLYDVLEGDVDAGVNVYEAYNEALSGKEIESVLSLGNIVAEARGVLEEALKRYPEITLEHLHLLSLFPGAQQGSLVEKFRSPVVAQALLQALNPFISKNGSEPSAKDSAAQQSPTAPKRSLMGVSMPMPEKGVKSTVPMRPFSYRAESSDDEAPLSSQRTFSRSFMSQDNPELPTQAAPTTGSDIPAWSEGKRETQRALLIELSYDCECGRHYRVNFRNMSVVVQKENELFEHVDLKPRTFQVHCGKCNSMHEFAVDGVEGETKRVFCRRCKPNPRRGVLDVNRGEVTWLD